MTEPERSPRGDLTRMFEAAVAACHPDQALPPFLPPRPEGCVRILAAGKGAAAMARAVERAWDPPLDGLVVTRHGFDLPLDYLPSRCAGHPVPDGEGARAAQELMALAASADPARPVILLLSGGASSLLAAPAPGYSLAAKAELTRALLNSGADIHEINCVRRHLSAVKGGRLAAMCPAPVLTLAISDVVGDKVEAIGSGPSVADPSTIGDARAILARYGIADQNLPWSESVKPGDPCLAKARYQIIARSEDALTAAARQAEDLGYQPQIIGRDLVGDAGAWGRRHGEMLRDSRGQGPRALISGGELTVTLDPARAGRGGPNQDYAAALALSLQGMRRVYALAADTDGIDGNHDAAGAFIDSATLARAEGLGIDLALALERHDCGGAFDAMGDLFRPGPTQTNVNDLRIILIDPQE